MARRRSYDATEEAPAKYEVPVPGSACSYYSAPDSDHARDNPQPLSAVVAGKGTVEGTVNLMVIEAGGTTINRSNVPCLEDGAEPPEGGGDYCMPVGAKAAEPTPVEETEAEASA